MLTNSDIEDLTQFRRALHQHPEISGEEIETARTIAAELKKLSPTRILTDLGGSGIVVAEVAAVGNAALADVSADGAIVAFSTADNLLGAADENQKQDVYAWHFPDPGNTQPTANLSAVNIDEDTRFTLSAALVSDADGDDVAVELVSGPAHAKAGDGFVFLPPSPGSPNGIVEYEPAADYFGNDAFTYRLRDGIGAWVEQVVTITVAAQPDDPMAVASKRLVLFTDEASGLIDFDLLQVSDVDYPGGINLADFELEIVTSPAGGVKDVNGAAVVGSVTLDLFPLTFTPAGNGTDSLTVRIKDDTDALSAPVVIEIFSGAERMGLSLHKGWNMVSFPVAPLAEARVALMAVTSGKLLYPTTGGRRMRRESIETVPLFGGQGFYVYVPAAVDLTDLPGDNSSALLALARGWNLIGPVSGSDLALPAGVRAAWRLNERGRFVGATSFAFGEALWLLAE